MCVLRENHGLSVDELKLDIVSFFSLRKLLDEDSWDIFGNICFGNNNIFGNNCYFCSLLIHFKESVLFLYIYICLNDKIWYMKTCFSSSVIFSNQLKNSIPPFFNTGVYGQIMTWKMPNSNFMYCCILSVYTFLNSARLRRFGTSWTFSQSIFLQR